MNEFEGLEQLIGCYLHEDYFFLYGSPEGAVSDFVKSEPFDAERVVRDISQALMRYPEDDDLRLFLRELGLGYLPSFNGWPSYHEWLAAVAIQVADELGTTDAADDD